MTFFTFCAIALLLPSSWAFSSPPRRSDLKVGACRNCDLKPNMYCDSSSFECKCRYGMVEDPWATSPNRTCLQKLGGACKVSDSNIGINITLPCVPNAKCDETGTCSRVRSIGEFCNGNSQCGTDKFTGSQLVCSTGKCSCDPSESVYAFVRRNAKLSEYQGWDRQYLCAPLATKQCFQGFCAPRAQCSSNYYVYCYLDGTLITKSAACECKTPYKINERTLECSAPFEQVCNFDVPCIDGLLCNSSTGRCGCPSGQFYEKKQEKCVTELGGFCRRTDECILNANCYDNRCNCKSGYTQLGAGGGAKCTAGHGFSCLQDSECDQKNNLICAGRGTKKTCVCKLGLKMFQKCEKCALQYGFQCGWPMAPSCGDDMKCVKGTCTCLDRMYFDRGTKSCVKSVGEACLYGTDCGTKAFCSHGVCRCDKGYVSVAAGGCAADFGTSCRSVADCAQTSNKLMCLNGTCACRSGLVWSPRTKLCSLEYGTRCNDNKIPCFGDLVCNGTCKCVEGRDFRNERCSKLAGEECRVSGDCLLNAECQNAACVCKQGYARSAAGLCDPGFGSPCSQSRNCDQSKNDLTCDGNGICGCPTGLKWYKGTEKCFLPFEAPCNGLVQCGDGLVCRQSKCQCPLRSQDFEETSGRCLHRVGGPCNETLDCIAGTFCDPLYHSSSINVGHCNCLEGTVETRDRRCINNKATSCSKDSDCDIAAGLECMDFQCRCSANAIYSLESRMCFGYVGTRCLPQPTLFSAMENRHAAVDSCIPNGVCGKRTSSTPVYECLCMCPKFIEAENNTCILSADYIEEEASLSSLTPEVITATERTTTTTATSKASAIVCAPVGLTTTPASSKTEQTEATISTTEGLSTETVTSTSTTGAEERFTDTTISTAAPSFNVSSTTIIPLFITTAAPDESSPDPAEFPDGSTQETMLAPTTTAAPSMNGTYNTSHSGTTETPTTKHPLGLGVLVDYI